MYIRFINIGGLVFLSLFLCSFQNSTEENVLYIFQTPCVLFISDTIAIVVPVVIVLVIVALVVGIVIYKR